MSSRRNSLQQLHLPAMRVINIVSVTSVHITVLLLTGVIHPCEAENHFLQCLFFLCRVQTHLWLIGQIWKTIKPKRRKITETLRWTLKLWHKFNAVFIYGHHTVIIMRCYKNAEICCLHWFNRIHCLWIKKTICLRWSDYFYQSNSQ